MKLIDPYLQGYQMGYAHDTEEQGTAEQDATMLKLSGDERITFIAAWNDGYKAAQKERAQFTDKTLDYEQMSKGYEKGQLL